MTTFHPKRGIGGYQFLNATINDVGDLRQYFSAVFADGYYVPRNRAWNMPNLNPRMGNFPALDNVLRNKAQRMR